MSGVGSMTVAGRHRGFSAGRPTRRVGGMVKSASSRQGGGAATAQRQGLIGVFGEATPANDRATPGKAGLARPGGDHPPCGTGQPTAKTLAFTGLRGSGPAIGGTGRAGPKEFRSRKNPRIPCGSPALTKAADCYQSAGHRSSVWPLRKLRLPLNCLCGSSAGTARQGGCEAIITNPSPAPARRGGFRWALTWWSPAR